jgi:hypothetical protein
MEGRPEIPGQLNISNTEMGFPDIPKTPIQNDADKERAAAREMHHTGGNTLPEIERPEADTEISRRQALLRAEIGTIPDPNPPKGQKPHEITIHNYLLREVDQSWDKAHRKSEIARIVVDRFGRDPEKIRTLAESYRKDYIEKLENDISKLREELDESIEINDRIYNPRAIRQQDTLRITITEAEENLRHKKDVANDIAYGLEKIADLL